MNTYCFSFLIGCLLLSVQFSSAQGLTLICGDSTTQVTKFDGQDNTFPLSMGGGSYDLDFNGDNIKEFTVNSGHWAGTSGISDYAGLTSADSSGFIYVELDTLYPLDMGAWQDSLVLAVKRMDLGDLISDTLNWHTGSFAIRDYRLDLGASHTLFTFGAGRGYVGLRVEKTGLSCMGWLETNGNADVFGYACNCTGPLALEADHIEGSIQIGPNPSNGQFSIRYRPKQNGRYKIEIHDLFGRLVTSRSGIAQLDEHVSFFDLQDERKGVYLVRVLQGKHKFHTRLIID